MMTAILTIGVLAAVMIGMALGMIFAGKPLRGSCGGANNCDCSSAQKAACAADPSALAP